MNRYVTWGGRSERDKAPAPGRQIARGRWAVAACVSLDDVRAVALPALRHRIMLNYDAEMDDIRSDEIIRRLLETAEAEEHSPPPVFEIVGGKGGRVFAPALFLAC